jgi:hypothetical protein
MIYMKRGRWMFRDENGKLHKFNSQEEAAKAKGLGLEKDYAEEEEKDCFEETNGDKAPSHHNGVKDSEEPKTKKS